MRRLILLLVALLAFSAPAHAQKRIALTFDDVPRSRGAFLTPEERTDRLIAAFRKARVKVGLFVNPGQIGVEDGVGGAERIARYVRAGHVIANHGYSHLSLSATPVDTYLADLDRAEAWLQPQPGYRPWYRFPFLDEGRGDKAKRDALRAALKARGLQNGYVTVDGSDWNMESNTIQAVKAGKTIDRAALRDLYVETMVEAAEFADGLAIKTLGRQPAQVILLHETDLAALYIGDVIRELRRRGWQIISPDQAYADPIHTAMPDVPSAQGTLLESMAWEKGLPAPRWYERNTIKLANALFAQRVLHEGAE
ncbi:polysaccharide deacetylase family protein [Sphingomonas sp. CJ20]